MGRDDAATVVADAMKAAGELVPVDEPLDLKHPPSVFISYQWGVQEKAVILKEYLTNAGFSCWLDIGQMGGGDKLYEKIDNGIRAAKVILSLVTEKYAKSANCNKEVNLSVNLTKPMFPLLMEKMPWPPSGAMGPIFSEYLFVRFFQRENERKEGIYWPEAKIEELIMQIRQVIEPDEKLVSKEMDDWWLTKTGNRVVGAAEKKLDNTKNPDVFISYQWGKQKEVYAFYKKLKSLGFTCWLDIEQMGAGDSLYDKIDRGIRNCKVVLSCVTEKYSLSLNCRREISLTSSLSKPIVPLLLEKTTWPPAGPMSMPLAQLKYVDCSKEGSLADEGCFNEILRRMAEHGVSLGSDGKAKPTKGKEPEKPAKGKEPEKAAPPANSQTDAKAADKSNSPAAQPKPTQSEAPAPPAKPEPAPKATSKSCVLL
ncbi:hypothetical protein EB796_015296 [Bugula neritina]|uniref:TIR domain-containing protein n=1 Tax=Bugula neritina TaxID=10212 RepID=A0A7J7JLZ1_BUGNE|nr:hypothetical protein EB796_015296 [Bugula neritina]